MIDELIDDEAAAARSGLVPVTGAQLGPQLLPVAWAVSEMTSWKYGEFVCEDVEELVEGSIWGNVELHLTLALRIDLLFSVFFDELLVVFVTIVSHLVQISPDDLAYSRWHSRVTEVICTPSLDRTLLRNTFPTFSVARLRVIPVCLFQSSFELTAWHSCISRPLFESDQLSS